MQKSQTIQNKDAKQQNVNVEFGACDTFNFSQQLEMEDEDTIDVFQQQTGGLIWSTVCQRFPSQPNQDNTAAASLQLSSIAPTTLDSGVVISLLHMTAVKYYHSCSCYLSVFVYKPHPECSDFRSWLLRSYCGKCKGLPTLMRLSLRSQTDVIGDQVRINTPDLTDQMLLAWWVSSKFVVTVCCLRTGFWAVYPVLGIGWTDTYFLLSSGEENWFYTFLYSCGCVEKCSD